MKSPWKFLAELTSRRNPGRTDNLPVDAGRHIGAVGRETLRVQIVVGNIPVNSPAAHRDQSPATHLLATTTIPNSGLETAPSLQCFAAVEEVHIETKKDVEENIADPAASLDQDKARASSPEVLPLKLAKALKKRGVSAASQAPIARGAQQGVEAATSFNGFASEDGASLDDQIKQLRNQLAQKLHQQNDQLRKMLERFDRS